MTDAALRAHLHVEIFLAKPAALHNRSACIQLQSWRTHTPVVPMDEVTGTGGELAQGATHPDTTIDRSPKRTVGEADFAFDLGLNFHADRIGAAPTSDEFPVADQQTWWLRLLDHNSTLAGVGSQAHEVAISATMPGLGEFVSDAIAKAKGVEHVMPVGARQLEGDALGVDPFAERVIGIIVHPKGPEVNVFDVADVVTFIDVDAAPYGVAGHIANEVPSGTDQLDALIGIEEQAVPNAHILSVVRQNARRIRHRSTSVCFHSG